MSAPVLSLPEVALLPDHAPLAVQLAASVDDQLSVVAEPLAIDDDAVVSVTVGAGFAGGGSACAPSP